MSTTQGPPVRRAAGIDVSKDRLLDVRVLPEAGSFSVAYDPSGIDSLVEWFGESGLDDLVVLEATGGYEHPAAAAISASGIAVAVVNPRR